MKQKAVEKMAQKDAYEFGLAQMFFGEGAGTRRKLVDATVAERMEQVPGYQEAFDRAFEKLSQVEMAQKAVDLRKSIDRAAKANKNLRALRRGNLAGLSNGLYVAGFAIIVAHQTGYDKKIEAEVKKAWANAKAKIENRNRRGKVYNFYSNHGMERDA